MYGPPTLTIDMKYKLHVDDTTIDLDFVDEEGVLEQWHSEDAGHHWTRRQDDTAPR